MLDWFTVVAQIANFALLVWLLKRFLYRPVLEAMAAREQRVRETVAAADRQKSEAETEAASWRARQAELAAQKDSLLKAARDEAARVREELLAQARQETETRAAQWREALARDWQEFRGQLARRTQDEALAIARQALRDMADAEIEERMVAAFLKKLSALDGGEKAKMQATARASTRPLLVRSAFPLASLTQSRVRAALHDLLATQNEVQFEVAPGVIAGVEVAFDGQKLAWTLGDFLRSLETSVNRLIEKEAFPHVRS